jgi:hypothetical protein
MYPSTKPFLLIEIKYLKEIIATLLAIFPEEMQSTTPIFRCT